MKIKKDHWFFFKEVLERWERAMKVYINILIFIAPLHHSEMDASMPSSATSFLVLNLSER